MKLALGTVQFGMDYGAFNVTGQVSVAEAEAILGVAEAAGIDTIDTARAYGTSEEALGSLGTAMRFRVITKIPALGRVADKAAAVNECLSLSRAALQTGQLDAVLFHSADDLLGDHAAICWNEAERACTEGVIKRLGVSVYDGAEALTIADRFPIKLVQLPVSVFDQRAIQDGTLDKLQERGIEVHARSVFLQGFALSDPDRLPKGLAPYHSELTAFHSYAKHQGVSPLQAAIGFVLAQPSIDRVIVGVQTARELEEICEVSEYRIDLAGSEAVASSDLQLLNPRLWA